MRRAVPILFLLMVCSIIATAQRKSFDLQVVNNEKISLPPGLTTNLVIRLVNNTNEDEMISLKLNLPKGWRCFSDIKAIRSLNSQTTIQILSINIPSNTPAADYSITIDAIESNGKKIGELKLSITVEPKFELKVDLINGPEYVFAGDSLLVQFMIQNLSNSKSKIMSILKGCGATVKNIFVLNPDSTIFITRKILVEKGILKSIQKSISLFAVLGDRPEINVSKSYSYNIIPSSDTKFDPFNRYPTQFSTFFVTDNRGVKREFALMADYSGKGFLDDKNTKTLQFHLRGPDRHGQVLYGIYDEYFIEYKSPRSQYLLGDNSFSLSNLTEFSRYARGASFEQSFKHFKIGSFINFPRIFPNIKREASVYAGYSILNKINLNIGYLNKQRNTGEINQLITINGTGAPKKWIEFAWEYAVGTVGSEYKKAFKTEVNFNLRSIQLFYNYTMAQKYFPGYFTDSRFMVANGNLALTNKININANYNENYQNIALDTIYGNAPFSKSLYLLINYRYSKNGGFYVSYNLRQMQDRIEPMKFDYNEHFLSVNFRDRIANFCYDLVGEYGKTNNFLLPEKERMNDLYSGQMTLNYRLSQNFNIIGFCSYQQSNRYKTNDYKNWIYSISINGSISKKLNLSFNYQSNYNIEESFNDRSLLDGRFTYSQIKITELRFLAVIS